MQEPARQHPGEERCRALRAAWHDAGPLTPGELASRIKRKHGVVPKLSAATLRRVWNGEIRQIDPDRCQKILDAINGDPSYEATSEADDARLPVEFFDDRDAFYSALTRALPQAQSRVRLTYVRQWPPTAYSDSKPQAAQEYFEKVLERARTMEDQQDCWVKRVIGVPVDYAGRPDPEFIGWLEREVENVHKYGAYEVKAFDWRGNADLRNIAVLDDQVVFETWSGSSRQQLQGHCVQSKRYAEGYIRTFDHLYDSNMLLHKYLASKTY